MTKNAYLLQEGFERIIESLLQQPLLLFGLKLVCIVKIVPLAEVGCDLSDLRDNERSDNQVLINTPPCRTVYACAASCQREYRSKDNT